MYLNPGTNASDKQVLTPLQVILKRTAILKDEAAERSKEGAKEKAAKAKYLGKLEKQFHMRGPSPVRFRGAAASSSAFFSPRSDDHEEDEED